VHVTVDPAPLELDESQTHVHRPAVAADQLGAAQPHRAVGKPPDRPRVGRHEQVMTLGR
jgi:hypothetical protein